VDEIVLRKVAEEDIWAKGGKKLTRGWKRIGQ
jgi:hypothetical protein